MSDHVHDCPICKVGYWECDDPDCGMDQDAPCMPCLKARLAAAESACREALEYIEQDEHVYEPLLVRLRAVLAGEGEAS